MTSIKGYTDLLQMAGPLSAQQEQFLATIRTNVDRMAVLVWDLADISRIESGRLKIELRDLNLRGVVDDALAGLRCQLEAKPQTLAVEGPPDRPRVRGDPDRRVQLLSNLIRNAHKYSPAGGPLALAAEAADGLVRASLVDHGYGIAPAD